MKYAERKAFTVAWETEGQKDGIEVREALIAIVSQHKHHGNGGWAGSPRGNQLFSAPSSG